MVNTNIYKYFRNNRGFFLPIIKLIQLFFKINQYWAFRPLKHGFLPISVYTISSGWDEFIHDTGYLVCRFLSITDKRDQKHSGEVTFQHFDLSLNLSCFKNLTGLIWLQLQNGNGISVHKCNITTNTTPLFELNKFF